jgi:precorrin-2 dehydrogenase/sirohydrochlorin ferrochelatase
VAAQKIKGLLAAEAKLKVISPVLVPELHSLVAQGKINHIQRNYREGDLGGAYLAIAATDDLVVNHAVWIEAQRCGCLVNIVDDPEHSNFFLPAVVQRGELSIAISTGGASPALARRLREHLEETIGTEYGILTEIMAELRHEIKADFPPGKARMEAASRVIDSDILNVIHKDGKETALLYARERLHE